MRATPNSVAEEHPINFTASSSVASASSVTESDGWVPVCLPEELPKGVRKEVEVDGRQVLLFWYRNQIYAIEGRSPTEGAYSEGFITAKFDQNYCIECPATGTLYSIKDGSIVDWYPKNPVLRALTPKDTGRKMDVYPVKLTQQAISVDVSGSTGVATRQDRGGAGTSLENNNVFTVQPNVYFEGMDPSKEQASVYQEGPKEALNPAVAATTVLAFGALAVAGTAVCAYLLFTQ
jgi:nitrite reductase/ring-hydroxylating ferredoxin subunit